MKTKFKKSPKNEQETEIKELLKNNNFRNNHNYIMWKNEKINILEKYISINNIKVSKGEFFYIILFVLVFINIFYFYLLLIKWNTMYFHPFILFFFSFYWYLLSLYFHNRSSLFKLIKKKNIVLLKKKILNISYKKELYSWKQMYDFYIIIWDIEKEKNNIHIYKNNVQVEITDSWHKIIY